MRVRTQHYIEGSIILCEIPLRLRAPEDAPRSHRAALERLGHDGACPSIVEASYFTRSSAGTP